MIFQILDLFIYLQMFKYRVCLMLTSTSPLSGSCAWSPWPTSWSCSTSPPTFSSTAWYPNSSRLLSRKAAAVFIQKQQKDPDSSPPDFHLRDSDLFHLDMANQEQGPLFPASQGQWIQSWIPWSKKSKHIIILIYCKACN